jgi:hypothetical protein
MSIDLGTQAITKSYEESKRERTKEIVIRTPLGGVPEIIVTREIVTYHDGVMVSKDTSKLFRITLEDLTSVDKLSIMDTIADTIDLIAPNK